MKQNHEHTLRHVMAQTEINLMRDSQVTLDKAAPWQLHNALSLASMDMIAPVWHTFEENRAGKRQAAYLSAEYLMGRMA